MLQEETLNRICGEYLSKCECCDECCAEFYCIENHLRSSRVPQDHCTDNLKSYLGLSEVRVGDCISRSSAIDVLNKESKNGAVMDIYGLKTAIDIIRCLPSVRPKDILKLQTYKLFENDNELYVCRNDVLDLLSKSSEKGYWYDVGSLSCRCSKCGCKNNRESRFCPNCGTEMENSQKHNFH